jgi:hypothetical protein
VLVDAGRPLPFAREGGLDRLISEGFGFSAAAVKKLRGGLGTVAALQNTEVPVAEVSALEPLLGGVAADRMRASLGAHVDSLTADSLGRVITGTVGGIGRSGPRAGRGKAVRTEPGREPDALDALIAGALHRSPR